MAIDLWLAFALASAVILAIPGPTVLLVCAYALSSGRRVGWWMVGGVSAGDLVAMSASLAGLGALMQSSALMFEVLRWIGAAYLIYLGRKLWRAPDTLAPPDLAEGAAGPRDGPKLAAHAFAVTATNPKSILFFIAFAPQFLDPGADAPPQMIAMVATFVGLAAANVAVYVLLADRLRRRLTAPGAMRLVNRIGGGALMGMGVLTALARRA